MTEDERTLLIRVAGVILALIAFSLTCAGAFRKATTADSYWDAFFMYLVGSSAIAIVLAVLFFCTT